MPTQTIADTTQSAVITKAYVKPRKVTTKWVHVVSSVSPVSPPGNYNRMELEVSKYESKEDLAAKVEWEGGVADAIEYGIGSLDLPEGTPTEIIRAWERVEASSFDIHLIEEWLESD